MSTEERLVTLSSEITHHRRKAANLRRRADAQDRIADEKVKTATALGTGVLPLMGMSDDPRASQERGLRRGMKGVK